jgi:hypothetical protein
MPPARIAFACGDNRTKLNPLALAQPGPGRPGTQQRRCRRPSYCPAQPAQRETGPPDRHVNGARILTPWRRDGF